MNILSKITVATLCLMLCLDATALLWETCESDSDNLTCGEKLYCNSNLKCGGDGTSGAHCSGTQDRSCELDLICDATAFTCRAKGTGLAGEKCDSSKDAACESGLICASTGSSAKTCRAAGTGAIGQPCGANDASCAPGVCDIDTYTCRRAGSGAEGEKCYYTKGTVDSKGNVDAGCIGFSCDMKTKTCRATTVSGGNGATCDFFGSPADTCAGICDRNTKKCRAQGNGARGSGCNSSGDPFCSNGACDWKTFTCRAHGSTNNGQKCNGNGDEGCNNVCDKITETCRNAGNGAKNANCLEADSDSSTSDAPCSSDSELLVCDPSIGKCRSIGHGTLGEACNMMSKNGDEYCYCVDGVCVPKPVPDPGTGTDNGGSAASRIYVPAFLIFYFLVLML